MAALLGACLVAAGPVRAGDNLWTTGGPGLTPVNVVATDPSSPATVYAGTGDGLFKSTDAGQTWTESDSGMSAPNPGPLLPISAIAVDPESPRTVYAAVGGIAVDATFGSLFKSTDGGANWTERDSGLPGSAIFSLAVDFTSSNIMYAGLVGGPFGAAGGIAKSTDAGSTWTQVSPANVNSVVICPANTAVLFAGGFGAQGILESVDAGASWFPAYSGPDTYLTGSLAIDPTNPLRIVAEGLGGVLPATGGFLRSTDGGSTWSPPNPAGPGFTVTAMAMDPAAPTTLYAGSSGGGVLRSTDSGATWAPLHLGFAAGNATSIATDFSGTRIYAGGDDGNVYADHLTAGPSACTPDANTLCLNNGRFQVQTQWTDFQGNTGLGNVVPVGSPDSGLMWFFGPDNWEMLVKVLNGCGVNQHYWVFAALTTNVQYTIQVTDTTNGQIVTYTNPLGNPAPAITDAAAFAGCP